MTNNLQIARLALSGLSAGDRVALIREVTNAPEQAQPDRIIHRAQVADRMGCTPRTIDTLARTGALQRIRLPGRTRGCGFRISQVDALIQGKATP